MGTRKKLQSRPHQFPQVRQWAEHQFSKGLSLIAVEFAVSQLHFAQVLADCCDVDVSQFPVAGQSEHWRGCWKSSSSFWCQCLEELDPAFALNVQKFSEVSLNEFTDGLSRELTTATVSRRRAMGRWFQIQNRLTQREFFSHLDDLITGPAEADVLKFDLQQNIGFLFLARIYIPALARFGLPPDVLYQQAITGDYQSLERMLALDPTTESMPEIQDVLWNLLRKKRPFPLGGNRPHIVRTLGFKRGSCKVQVIAWIRDYSQLLVKAVTPELKGFSKRAFGIRFKAGRAFSVPDLQLLFDAYARDQTGFIDPDLSTGDTLRKMVDRCSKAFPLSHWDIFSQKDVPVKGDCSA